MGLSSFLRLLRMRFVPWNAISYGGLNIRWRSRAYIVERSRNICHVTNTNKMNPLKKQTKEYECIGSVTPPTVIIDISSVTSVGGSQNTLKPGFCVILSALIGFPFAF